jgi:hypothetical protein
MLTVCGGAHLKSQLLRKQSQLDPSKRLAWAKVSKTLPQKQAKNKRARGCGSGDSALTKSMQGPGFNPHYCNKKL